MQLRYQLDKAALVQGARLQNGDGQAIVFGTVLFAVFAVTQLLELFDKYQGTTLAVAALLWLLFCAVAGLAAAALTIFVMIPIRAGSLYRQNPILYGAMELREDDDGIEIRGPRMTSRFAWSDFRGFKENKAIFLLCLSKSIGQPVTKQEMSDDIIRAFRSRLEQKMRRLPRWPGMI
ncbi:YcxB family protein [Bradyrhizobium sp. HKCCYLS20291]|uniref:YcxB family protein n=1 Tax=Bradyrhizobium sp. HKCCYLS20291 TaxID=3420766 RepID=UPI003EB9692A